MNSSRRVKLANKATSARLSSLVSTSYELPSNICQLKVLHSNEVKKSQRNLIWTLFEDNMYDLYKVSSLGWHPDDKRKELFHSLSRFILVSDEDKDLLAFCMFRFEHEEDEDLVYLYDIQVASSAQGKGIGKKLVGELENLCKEYSMEKIMLTVLKSNRRAAAVYKSIGFTIDPASPTYVEDGHEIEGDETVDYDILSKAIEDSDDSMTHE